MRFTRMLVGVAASLASFATGAATTDEVPVESERGREPTERVEATGYAASGPSFYVWDEDPRQGRQWAAELGRGGDPSSDGAGAGGAAGLDRSEA